MKPSLSHRVSGDLVQPALPKIAGDLRPGSEVSAPEALMPDANEGAHTPGPVVVTVAREASFRGTWMHDHAEAHQERIDVFSGQVAEQLRNAQEQPVRD
jgi:hypothetical protein